MAFYTVLLYKATILCLEDDKTSIIYVATDENISVALKIAEDYCDSISGDQSSYVVIKIKDANNGLVCVELIE